MNNPEILSYIDRIVREGFDYEDPCNFIDDREGFINVIVYGSNITFINSYDELNNISPVGEEFIFDFIKKKFLKVITNHYDFWISDGYCDE